MTGRVMMFTYFMLELLLCCVMMLAVLYAILEADRIQAYLQSVRPHRSIPRVDTPTPPLPGSPPSASRRLICWAAD